MTWDRGSAALGRGARVSGVEASTAIGRDCGRCGTDVAGPMRCCKRRCRAPRKQHAEGRLHGLATVPAWPPFPRERSPTGFRCTGWRWTARARRPCWSPSTPARAPSAPRRTAWPTSSSTSSSRAARSTRHYRDVNETAERLGGALNAYTSHDLVAFHITVRAEARAGGDRPADRLRRPPAARRRGARPRARRRHPGDRPRSTTSRPPWPST